MLYPMFAMLILTLLVGVYMLLLRVNAVRTRQVKISEFRLNKAIDIPDNMAQASRNYTNLFEIPVLFYAAGCTCLALNIHSSAITSLAWVFVASRVLHSWIHLTNNHIMARLMAFVASILAVLAIWVMILLTQALA